LTGDVGRGCGDASRALLFFEDTLLFFENKSGPTRSASLLTGGRDDLLIQRSDS
jgi:hypothetical protein